MNVGDRELGIHRDVTRRDFLNGVAVDRAGVIGRKQFGRSWIENADAAGSSHTDAAIDMAYRAVGEAIEPRTRAVGSKFTRLSQ